MTSGTETKTAKGFSLVYSANVTYTLTEYDLGFLNNGQTIEVIPSEGCRLVIFPPTEQENT